MKQQKSRSQRASDRCQVKCVREKNASSQSILLCVERRVLQVACLDHDRAPFTSRSAQPWTRWGWQIAMLMSMPDWKPFGKAALELRVDLRKFFGLSVCFFFGTPPGSKQMAMELEKQAATTATLWHTLMLSAFPETANSAWTLIEICVA